MKGHIRERSPGHWAIVIELRDPETGKRQAQMAYIHGHQAEGARRVRAADFGIERWPLHRTGQDHGRAISRPLAGAHQAAGFTANP